MITRRFPNPRGLNSETKEYGFYVRVSGESRELLKMAREKAEEEFGDRLSNAMLLQHMMRVYTGRPSDQSSLREPTEGVDCDIY